MKVLVVGTGGAIVSGISTAADELVATLVEAGHDASRTTAGDAPRQAPNAMNVANLMAVLGDAVAVRRAARRSRADVVWLDVFGVPVLPAARALALAMAARASGARVIIRYHAFGLEDEVAGGGRALRLLVRAAGRLADRLVTVHEAAAVALRRLGPRAEVVALPNWVAVPPEPIPMPPGPPWTAVFVGGVVRRKGAPQLVAAARLLDGTDVRLRLVGGPAEDGPERFASLVADAADVVGTGVLTFVGELDPAGVREELDGGHIFVLPSEAEGMPMAMVEALARGRGVVVTAAGNMGEFVATHACGRVLPDRDPATIAAALTELAADPVGLAELGVRAHAAAEATCSVGAAQVRLERILAVAAPS